MTTTIHHDKGHFQGAGKERLFYQCWRPKDGKKKEVLAFVHGMGEHSSRYQFPVSYFNGRDYTVYAMDLRGHGNSGGRRSYAESLDDLVEDIRLFVEHVRHCEKGKKVFLVGHSFGGQLVLNYGTRFPKEVAGIIVSSPNLRLRLPLPLVKRLAAPVLSWLLPRLALGNELDPKMVSKDPAVVEAYRNDPQVQKKITARLADIVLKNHLKVMDLAERFRVPCLLMHAGDDVICHPGATEEFFQRIPIRDKTFRVYEGYYHELFNEVGKERVFHDMEQWIVARS